MQISGTRNKSFTSCIPTLFLMFFFGGTFHPFRQNITEHLPKHDTNHVSPNTKQICSIRTYPQAPISSS